MHYILFVSLEGFYTDAWSGTDDRAHVVTHEGAVLDSCPLARARGVRPGTAVSEAKAVLREGAVYREFVESAHRERRDAWLDVCAAYSDAVEPGLPHEAFVDLTAHPDPVLSARSLLRAVTLTWAAALAPAKWMARLAASEGLTVVEDARSFVQRLPTQLLTPVPPEHRDRLEFLGYRWAREVDSAPATALTDHFGRDAFLVREVAGGRWLDTVVPSYPARSVSHRILFESPLGDRRALDEAFRRLAEELASRLCASDSTADVLTLCTEPEDGAPLMVKRRLGKPVQAATPLFVALQALWQQSRAPFAPCAVRAVLSGLNKSPRGQKALMGLAGVEERKRACETAVRTLCAAHGEGKVLPATDVTVPRREAVLRAWRRATGWR